MKPGWTCADVGANVGILSRVMARQVGIVIELHDETDWVGRDELLKENYDFYDIKGKISESEINTDRIYHCVTYPKEKMNKPY